MTTTQAVLDAIRSHVGRENAVTARRLIASLRMQGVQVDDREIRQIVENVDEPICTGNPGYWLAGDPNELSEPIRRLKSQAIKNLHRADRLEDWQRRLATPVVQQLSFLEGAA